MDKRYLTEIRVRDIRALCRFLIQKKVAEIMSVSPIHVSRIVRREAWRDV